MSLKLSYVQCLGEFLMRLLSWLKVGARRVRVRLIASVSLRKTRGVRGVERVFALTTIAVEDDVAPRSSSRNTTTVVTSDDDSAFITLCLTMLLFFLE